MSKVKAGQRWLVTDGDMNSIFHIIYVDDKAIRAGYYEYSSETPPWGVTSDTETDEGKVAEAIDDLINNHLLMLEGESPSDTRMRLGVGQA